MEFFAWLNGNFQKITTIELWKEKIGEVHIFNIL